MKKNKVLFIGNINKNNGPSNVNKKLYKLLKEEFHFICGSRITFFLKSILLIPFYDCIIYSGILKGNDFSVKIAKKLHKKIIYIMHGCVSYEQLEINKTPSLNGEKIEEIMWQYSNKILLVSQTFKEWFDNYKKEFAFKTDVLYNGIDWEEYNSFNENMPKENKIILTGMGRKTKNNLIVIKSIENINRKLDYNKRIIIEVFGYKKEDDDSNEILKYENVKFCGMISHDELMKEFKTAKLFIQNSIVEPFSLAVVEAIINNCNILISKNVGAKDILYLNERDIIYNIFDEKEIENKISNFFEHDYNNKDEIVKKIDKKHTSVEYSANKLKVLTKELIGD